MNARVETSGIMEERRLQSRRGNACNKTGIKRQTMFDHDLPEADAVDAPAAVPFVRVLCDLPLFLLPLLLFFLPLSPLNLAAA
jgi:hypothetical protein